MQFGRKLSEAAVTEACTYKPYVSSSDNRSLCMGVCDCSAHTINENMLRQMGQLILATAASSCAPSEDSRQHLEY